MGSVSDIVIDKWVDQALDQLDTEKTYGIALSEFTRTIIDRPENHSKIANSYSGHAVDLQNRAILRELRLWCCRVWDTNGNGLPGVCRRIEGFQDKIIETRRVAHPDWSEEALGCNEVKSRVLTLSTKVQQVLDGEVLAELKVTRNEHLVHLNHGRSGARRSRPADSDGYSYNEILDLADTTVKLISEAIFLWQFRSHSDDASRRIVRKYFERYWRLLPNFAQLERQEANKIDY